MTRWWLRITATAARAAWVPDLVAMHTAHLDALEAAPPTPATAPLPPAASLGATAPAVPGRRRRREPRAVPWRACWRPCRRRSLSGWWFAVSDRRGPVRPPSPASTPPSTSSATLGGRTSQSCGLGAVRRHHRLPSPRTGRAARLPGHHDHRPGCGAGRRGGGVRRAGPSWPGSCRSPGSRGRPRMPVRRRTPGWSRTPSASCAGGRSQR